MLHRILRTALVLLGSLAPVAARAEAADAFAEARMQFQAAYAAVPVLPPDQAVTDGNSLRAYPLYPYLQAARLQRRLAALPPRTRDPASAALQPVDAAIEAFLTPLGRQPVTRELRRDWLLSLARREAWAKFLEVYELDRDGENVTLRCHSYAAGIALGRTDALADSITATWLAPKTLPDACEPAFAWLRSHNALGDELVERRARLALQAGDAALGRFLTRTLTPQAAAPLLQWAALIEQPRSSVEVLIANPARPVEARALLDGWERFAHSDAEAAAAAYPALVAARKLEPRAAGPYALAVAVSKAWSRQPGALEFFGRADPEDFDERAHEWYVRAALWAGDWARVRAAIAAMPEALRNQNRWRYWAARAAQQLGEAPAAQQAYAALLPTDNWYAMLAAARLGRTFAPSPQPLPIDGAEVARLGNAPGFVRAHELLLCAMMSEATSEWRASFDPLPAAQQVQAVGLASRWGWHLQAITAAARQGLFNDYDLLYPRPYDTEVRAAALRTGLPEELIYAILRQESLYRADALSRAGALGLMQLLPETARRTAIRSSLPPPTRSSLLTPAVNIPLGSATLKSLLDRAAGQTALAVAGYNAGPGAVRRWLPGSPMDTDVWVENIPFNETRTYVQRVTWHSLVFAWLSDRTPRDLAKLLEPIRTPAPDAALAPATP